ncbi:UNVERIFIED_CONTAM: Retrovirus-related Pol polyprotein from transposon TNT 1-94 [Sesamum angustifolium]|uniref:Retrovirus-related Pol polyprotein from transposon TNT 1-94 n=1 Tax=Sesamum angustifolium TaxID=2727405 RepID=A0AAW2L658_9LAMI
MMEKGYTLHFGGDSYTIYDNKDKTLKIVEVRMKEHMLSNTSPIYGPHSYESTRGPVMAMAQEARSFQLPRLKNNIKKKMMTDLPQIQAVEGACEACLQGKQHKKPFPSGTSWRAKAVLELIHTDVCGPMRTPSHEQNRYFILFIDDYSRMTWVYFMQKNPKSLRRNTCQKLFGQKQSTLQSIYSTVSAMYTIQQRKGTSWREDGERIFLGYSTQSKGYRIYNLKTKKLIISRDVEFDEDAMWNWDEEKVERQSVMIPKRHLRNNSKKRTNQAEMERRSQQAPGSPRRPPSSEEIEE